MKKIIALVALNLVFTAGAFAKTGKQDSNVPCSQIAASLKEKGVGAKPGTKPAGAEKGEESGSESAK